MNCVKVMRQCHFNFPHFFFQTQCYIVNKKNVLKILIGSVSFVILIKLVNIIVIEPLIRDKILESINKNNSGYVIAFDRARISMISSVLELKNITISVKNEPAGCRVLCGEIAFIKFKGIKLAKALIRKDIDIRKVTISDGIINGRITFPKEGAPPIVVPLNIRIENIFFNKINLSIGNSSTSESYTVKEGNLKIYNFQVEKKDTISTGIINKFDFDFEEFAYVSSDSMYMYKLNGVLYNTTSNTLSITDFSVQPNHADYEFTSKYAFQKIRLEASFSNIYIYNFSASDYFRSGSIESSYTEIGNLNMNFFRDKRKEFRHVNKPVFQDIIYNYPGIINIDSIAVLSGNIIYKEHAEEANEPGSISLNEVNTKIYNITNDTVYKTRNAFLKISFNAMLMGKSKLTVLLNSRIFDMNNTFSLNGTLSRMEANELNPILEKNAFIYTTSGIIESINFNFTANNTESSGKMTMLYNEMNISVKNKKTDDTTAFREKFISVFANIKVLDSNPIPGEGIREGIIDYKRDPERYVFSYCFKSIMSGIKSSLVRNHLK